MDSNDWRNFEVDGQTFYWTSQHSKQKVGDGTWEPIELLTASRTPNTPGVGMVLLAGTTITERHAADVVRMFKAHHREIP